MDMACSAPVAFDTLVGYWLGELEPAETERIDEHIIGCSRCSARLAEIVALSEGIRAVFHTGDFHGVLTGDFVERLVRQGVRVRQYRISRNGSVNCTVAPEDELVVGRLEAPLSGITRVDVLTWRSLDGAEARLEDVPFNARAGEVVIAPNVARLRELPAHRHVVRLVAVEGGAEHVLGEFTFNHGRHAQ